MNDHPPRARGALHAAGAVFSAAVGVALALALAYLILSLVDRFDPLTRDAHRRELERHRELDERLWWLDTAVAAGWRVLPLALAGVFGGITALGLYNRFARWEVVVLDKRADLVRAQVQTFPRGLQSLSFHDSRRHQLVAPPERIDAPAGASAGAPAFAQLLAGGQIGRGNPMVLGYDAETGAAIEGSWLDLYSCGVGGLSGTGKTWTAAYLACQGALYGSRFVVCDPHAPDPQSLAQRLAPLRSRFVCDVADEPGAIRSAIGLVLHEYQERKAGRGSREPWIFIADEFSALQRGDVAAPLAELTELLGQEGRKLQLFGLFCGQMWTAARSGGTEARDSLASCYIHRLRPAQARYLSGLRGDELPADLLHLAPGQAYFLSTAGELRKVTIPEMSPADVAKVAALLAPEGAQASDVASGSRPLGFRPSASGKPDGSLTEAGNAQASKASISPDAARAMALFRQGLDVAQIVKELFGVESSSGRRYQEAAREVQRLLREAMGGE